MYICIILLLSLISIVIGTMWVLFGEYKTLRYREVEYINLSEEVINLSSEECDKLLGNPLSVNDEYKIYDAGYISHDRFLEIGHLIILRSGSMKTVFVIKRNYTETFDRR